MVPSTEVPCHAILSLLTTVQPVLNSFAAFETSDRRWVRSMLIDAITNPQSCLVTDTALNAKAFVPIEHVTMHLPMKITDYTDSFSSLIHAQNVGGPYLNAPPPQTLGPQPRFLLTRATRLCFL